MQPELKIMTGKAKGPAIYKGGVVYYDSVFIAHLFEKYESSFVESSIAYLLSHELGHYHLRHTDTHLKLMAYANTGSKDAVYSGTSKYDDILFKESEADLYGGLFSVQAGYYSLDIAEQFLQEVYDNYHLPPELPGYPSLKDRIEVAENLESIVQDINEVYQLGLALAYMGKHATSQSIFKSIIRESNFKTPEILHSLSYSIFLSSVSETDNDLIINWRWPVNISFESYKTERQRSSGQLDALKNLDEALKLELEALALEEKTNSNLKNSIELLQSYFRGDVKSYVIGRDLNSSLMALGYQLMGKPKKASRIMNSSNSLKSSIQSNDENPRQSLNQDVLVELRFADYENLVLNGKRIAKKYRYGNYYWYEIRAFNGVKINVYREDVHTVQSLSPSLPNLRQNSVTFYNKNNSIKYILE
jgi:hypothetical protein